MKFNLLASVSTAAIGGVIAATLPQPANATLTCTAATFSCSEKIDLGKHVTDFSNLTATFDFFNPGTSGSGPNLVPANATLQSVVITEGGVVNSSGFIINTASAAQSFSFTFTERMMLSAGQNTPSAFPVSSVNTIKGNTKYVNVPVTSTAAYYANVQPNNDRRYFSFIGTFTTSGHPFVYSMNGSSAASFLGTGTFTALVSSSTFSGSAGGGGNVGQSLNTTADPIFTLVYNYSVPNVPLPTPEPASLAALGVGLTGLGAVRRRRKD